MTQDEIIMLADEAGFGIAGDPEYVHAPGYDGICTEELEAFAKLVEAKASAKEREACAKLCDELDSNSYPYVVVFPNKCAEAIRARGGQ